MHFFSGCSVFFRPLIPHAHTDPQSPRPISRERMGPLARCTRIPLIQSAHHPLGSHTYKLGVADILSLRRPFLPPPLRPFCVLFGSTSQQDASSARPDGGGEGGPRAPRGEDRRGRASSLFSSFFLFSLVVPSQKRIGDEPKVVWGLGSGTQCRFIQRA